MSMPPRHLADLDVSQRRAAVVELGQPGYRADQLSRQYFGRFENDVAAMSDVPHAARESLGVLLPPLLSSDRSWASPAIAPTSCPGSTSAGSRTTSPR